jgi:hypothetical protein
MKTKSVLVTIAGILAASLTSTLATGVTSVTTFGPLAGETFGGTGIPNDAVQITTISGPIGPSGSSVITLGLSATPRFTPGELGNNGAGTFNTATGVQWNFDFTGGISGGGTLADFQFKLFYDLDPATGTPLANLGEWDLNVGQPSTGTSVHNSEFPGFNFLKNGVAGAVTPPNPDFTYDINAPGEYTFALGVYDAAGAQIGDLDTINVKVNSVPDTASTAGLMVLGVIGLFAMKKHTAKQRLVGEKQTA